MPSAAAKSPGAPKPDTAPVAAARQVALAAEVAPILNEWRLRREAVDAGESELLHKMLAQRQADPASIFSNTDVHLSDYDCHGFDFDYTLCSYKEPLHELIYQSALRILIDKFKYPAELGALLRYDPTFPARGVFFEPQHGNILKLDATNRVEVAFFGRKKLARRTINRLYSGNGHLRHDHVRGMRMMADLFCFAEIGLLADVIHWLASTPLTFVPAYVYSDVMASVGEVHRSGLLYNAVLRSPDKYVDPPRHLAEYFRRLREAGKRTFLLTNSPYHYVDGVMQHVHGRDWRSLFDTIVVQAQKPDFYVSERPFRRVNPFTGRVDWAPLTSWPPTDGLGNVVLGGNLRDFVRLTGYDRVLYCGDHVEADMRDPRRLGWRTAMILSELSRDVAVQNSDAYRAGLTKLLEAKDFLANIFSCRPYLSAEAKQAVLGHMGEEMEGLREEVRALFGSRFGSVFSSDTQSSLFGLRMYRWTDLYTAKVDHFNSHPVDAFLSPGGTTRTLPHDVRVVV